MNARTPSRQRAFDTPELDREIAAAAEQAIVMWRGERVRFDAVPERIARIDNRDARDRLYGAYCDALEALNPLYQRRLAAWKESGDPVAVEAKRGLDPSALAVSLERFSLHGETSYHAALRRYLALIDIEQGDATEADLWHVIRGGAWAHWFDDREVARAVGAAGRDGAQVGDLDGWRAAERRLAGEPQGSDPTVAAAISRAFATVAGSPEWLGEELRVSPSEVASFVDFAAFVRLWRIRRLIAELQYELRLYATDEPAVQRAYYSGILGHMTGVGVAEAGYLAAVDAPFASARTLQSKILAGMIVDMLEQGHGALWWRDPASMERLERLSAAPRVDDAIAELGYDGLDWRPVLRQIRTRLIGEMSGYGGPNITTRAGTRKV